MHRTTPSSTAEPKIVVHGGIEPYHVWPAERPGPALRQALRAAEVGDPERVVALLAEADGVDEDDYLATHGADVSSIRALTAHCELAILHAALEVDGPLSPAAVLASLHGELAAPADRRRELLDLLAS